jgi:hypothetical protein
MTEQPQAPEPFLSGTFALYERPDGSVVLAYRTADGAEGQRVIPAPMVKLGLRAAKRAAQNGNGNGQLLLLEPAAGD